MKNMGGSTPLFQFLCMVEEVGEVANCLVEDDTNLVKELADVMVTVLTLADSAGVLEDLELAFDVKMIKNLKKTNFTAAGKIKT